MVNVYLKNILAFFWLLFLTLSCSNEKKKTGSEIISIPDSTEKISNEIPGSPENNNEVLADTLNEWTIVNKDTIWIKTELERLKLISTPNQEEKTNTYSYVGYNENNNYHIVSFGGWEFYGTLLINHKTSSFDTIWSEPIFSPNDSNLISKSMDYGLEGAPNGYQLWTLKSDGKWKKLNEVDQQEWVPIEFKWISDSTFQIKTVTVNHYNESNWDVEKLNDFSILKKSFH